jgi:hypothetical protein
VRTEPQLKAKIWAEALMRRARLSGAFAYLRHHGDDDAGVVLIKIALMDGRAMLWAPERNEHYQRKWVCQSQIAQSEADVDEQIERAMRRDPDLWVVEIEDPKARHFLLPNEFTPLDEG